MCINSKLEHNHHAAIKVTNHLHHLVGRSEQFINTVVKMVTGYVIKYKELYKGPF